MWKQWVCGILGLIFIITPFLGLTTFIFKTAMALGGIVFAILGFWTLSEERLAIKNRSYPDGGKEGIVESPHD